MHAQPQGCGWLRHRRWRTNHGTTAIEVQVDADTVTAQLDVPVGKLGDALGIKIDTDLFSLPQLRGLIATYVTDHLEVSGVEGAEWAETVGQLMAINIDGVMHLRLLVAADPGGSVPDELTVDYDGILATDDSHEIYVTAVHGRADAASNATLVGVIDSHTPALTVRHSITPVASALGWVSLPSRPVEILVAVSVAVAAIRVLRPFAVRSEEAIAGVFGLIHGLAISGLLDHLGLLGLLLATVAGVSWFVTAARRPTVSPGDGGAVRWQYCRVHARFPDNFGRGCFRASCDAFK